jgi:electron transport complex protein RnfG
MKSSLKNMVLVLFCITLISSACVGLVNMITEEPIAKAKAAAEKKALTEVVPGADDFKKMDKSYSVEGLDIEVYTALKDQDTVGYAIKTATKNGFSGMIKMMVGFDMQSTILNVKVLEQSETPGLGAKAADWFQKGQPGSIVGLNPAETNLTVKNDGGEVSAITASTITSRAFLRAVQQAYLTFMEEKGK